MLYVQAEWQDYRSDMNRNLLLCFYEREQISQWRIGGMSDPSCARLIFLLYCISQHITYRVLPIDHLAIVRCASLPYSLSPAYHSKVCHVDSDCDTRGRDRKVLEAPSECPRGDNVVLISSLGGTTHEGKSQCHTNGHEGEKVGCGVLHLRLGTSRLFRLNGVEGIKSVCEGKQRSQRSTDAEDKLADYEDHPVCFVVRT